MGRKLFPVVLLMLIACCNSLPFNKVQDLHAHYNDIFPTRNRNAASHRWSTFILERSHELSHKQIEMLFTGFCAVSGSPVTPGAYNRYDVVLASMGGGAMQGQTYHCCWPCLCDLHDYVRVDSKTIKTADGDKTYTFFVIGDPCVAQKKLDAPFEQAQGWGPPTSVLKEATDVTCDSNGKLEKATYSDHGGVIIGMLHGAQPANQGVVTKSFGDWVSGSDLHSGKAAHKHATYGGLRGQSGQPEAVFAPKCAQRAKSNYNSGMGFIFRQVAKTNLLQMQHDGNAIDCKEHCTNARTTLRSGAPLKDSELASVFACQGVSDFAV